MGGGGNVQPRDLGPEERALIQAQTDLISQAGGIFGRQANLQELLQPSMLESLGFSPTIEMVPGPRETNPEYLRLQQQLAALPESQTVYDDYGDPTIQPNPERAALEEAIANTPQFLGGDNLVPRVTGISADRFADDRLEQTGRELGVTNRQLELARIQLNRGIRSADTIADIQDIQLQNALNEAGTRVDLSNRELQNALVRQQQRFDLGSLGLESMIGNFGARSDLERAALEAEGALLPNRLALEQSAIGTDLARQAAAQSALGSIGQLQAADMALQPGRLEAEQRAIGRLNSALAGDLPVSPALLRDLKDREDVFNERLRRSLGADFAASTPGAQSLLDFEDFRNVAIEEARRADIAQAGALVPALGAANRGIQESLFRTANPALQSPGVSATQNAFGAVAAPAAGMSALQASLLGAQSHQGAIPAGAPFLGGGSFPGSAANMQQAFGVAGGAGGAASGLLGTSNAFSGPQSVFQNQRQMDLQAQVANLNAPNPIAGILGNVAGAAAYGYFASSRSVKDRVGSVDSEEALRAVEGLDVDRWRYHTDDVEHIGPYAEDFKEATGLGDGETISVIDALGLALAAIKGLRARVAELEARDG